MSNLLKPKKYVFFSLNDFSTDGGGTIRMYGLLNSLAEKGESVTFISNASSYKSFHPSIHHININYPFSHDEKRKFQFLLANFGVNTTNFVFKNLRKRLKLIFSNYNSEPIYFFEYLDNSLGYWLFKNKIINHYINDIHGIAPLEFSYQKKHKTHITSKISLSLKAYSAKRLDNMVIAKSLYNIYASEAMYDYFKTLYPNTRAKKKVVIPNLLANHTFEKKVNWNLFESSKKKLNLTSNDRVLFFAGGFKLTGGVIDLIKAFELLTPQYPNLKLLLLGDGPEKQNCENYVQSKSWQNKVIFLGRKPYHELRTYQELADIIVCPDRDNPYSHLIVHLKYLDALISNKIVINGSFKSVEEINTNESLSLKFKPSDVKNLSEVIQKILNNYNSYKIKYDKTKEVVKQNLMYSKFISKL